MGDPRNARPRAPDRRAREGGRDRQRLVRPREPRPDGAAPRREGRGDRGRHPGARGRRSGRRRHARPRLGLDVRRDRRGRAARARERAQGRDGASPPPEPVPAQHGRGRARLRQGAHPGDEPRPAADADPRGVPRRRGGLQQGARASVPGGRARGRDHGAGGLNERRQREPRAAHREGLQVRPGGSLVPGLRRLRDPQRHPGLHARARARARAHRVRLRDRLRGALPVLHADLRDALDPRARAGDRDRSRRHAAGSLGLGRRRATATRSRSAATTSSTRCAAT